MIKRFMTSIRSEMDTVNLPTRSLLPAIGQDIQTYPDVEPYVNDVSHGRQQMEINMNAFRSLAILAVLAFFVPLLLARFKRTRIPVAVGEILTGVIIGNSGLRLVRIDPLIELLSFLGLASVMFISGLEVNLDLFTRPRRAAGAKVGLHPVLLALAIFTVSLIGALYVGDWLSAQTGVHNAFAAGLIVATCGLSLIVPVLKEREALHTNLGRQILMVGVLADFLPVVGLAVVVPLAGGGDGRQIWLVAAIIGFAAAAYLLLRFTQSWWQLPSFTQGSTQLGVRWAFALMIIFLALAEHLRVEAVLGAFLAGIIASLLSGSSRETLIEKLDVLGFGFLTPFFFFSVGIRFNLQQLLGNPTVLTLVPLLIGLTLAVKIIPGLLLLVWYPWREALASAVLLGTQMSVTIAAAELVQRAGLITPPIHQAFVMVAMITAVIAPVISAKIALPFQPGIPMEKWVVVGNSRQATLLAGRLAVTGVKVLLAGSMVKGKWEVERSGVEFMYIDSTSPEAILPVAQGATVFIAMSGDDTYNLTVCKLVQEQLDVQRIYVLLSSPHLIKEAQALGIAVVNPELATLQLLANQVINPNSTSLLEQEAGIHMTDFRITNPAHTKKPLRSIHLPPTVLIVAIWREGEKIIPHGDTQLLLKDRVTVVGPADDLELMHHLFIS